MGAFEIVLKLKCDQNVGDNILRNGRKRKQKNLVGLIDNIDKGFQCLLYVYKYHPCKQVVLSGCSRWMPWETFTRYRPPPMTS